MIIIAIDPGVNNGLAIFDKGTNNWLYTGELPIWDVFPRIDSIIDEEDNHLNIKTYIEDPRMIGGSPGKAQGAGWVKILAGQYEMFCLKRGLRYECIRPNSSYTKKDSAFVLKQTGIQTLDSEHNRRDAIMLLYYYGLH